MNWGALSVVLGLVVIAVEVPLLGVPLVVLGVVLWRTS